MEEIVARINKLHDNIELRAKTGQEIPDSYYDEFDEIADLAGDYDDWLTGFILKIFHIGRYIGKAEASKEKE